MPRHDREFVIGIAERHGNPLRGTVLHAVDEGSFDPGTDRDRRQNCRGGRHAGSHPDRRETPRREAFAFIDELGPDARRAGPCVEHIVEGGDPAGGKRAGILAVVRFHRRAARGSRAGAKIAELRLRDGKGDRDGIDLGDRDDAVGIAGAHGVAGIYAPDADPAAHRQEVIRVKERLTRAMSTLARSRRTVGAKLVDFGLLLVDRLLRNRIALDEAPVPGEIEFGGTQLRRVACQLRLGGGERRALRPIVDRREQLAAPDEVAFGEMDAESICRRPAPGRRRSCNASTVPTASISCPTSRRSAIATSTGTGGGGPSCCCVRAGPESMNPAEADGCGASDNERRPAPVACDLVPSVDQGHDHVAEGRPGSPG